MSIGREAIDLSHIRSDSLKTLIIEVLENYVGMCTSTVDMGKATQHRITLHLETKPMLQKP